MTACDAPLAGAPLSVPADTTCTRTDPRHVVDGVGSHQAWVDVPASGDRAAWRRLVTWSHSGSSASSASLRCRDCVEAKTFGGARSHPQSAHRYEPCIDCGTLHNCVAGEPGRCTMCAIWHDNLTRFTSQRPGTRDRRGRAAHVLVRPDGSDDLYSWSPGSTGGFGGRRYVVTVRDTDGVEHTFGPADSLWFSGTIPTWLRDAFEPNGTITAA